MNRLSICLLTASVLSIACDSDLPAFNEIEGLRLLAISADAPWVMPGESTSLSALVVSEEEVSYRWTWCPLESSADENYRCPIAEDTRPEGVPSFDLGMGTEATLRIPTQEQLCALLEFGCEPRDSQGERAERVEVYVRLEVSTSSDRIVGVRRVVVSQNTIQNGLPQLKGVTVDLPHERVNLMEEGITVLPFQEELTLEAEIEPESFEPLGEGESEASRENLTVSWFVKNAELELSRTRPVGGVARSRTTNQLMVVTGRRDVELYVVLRDDRDGTSWRSYAIRFSDEGENRW